MIGSDKIIWKYSCIGWTVGRYKKEKDCCRVVQTWGDMVLDQTNGNNKGKNACK